MERLYLWSSFFQSRTFAVVQSSPQIVDASGSVCIVAKQGETTEQQVKSAEDRQICRYHRRQSLLVCGRYYC